MEVPQVATADSIAVFSQPPFAELTVAQPAAVPLPPHPFANPVVAARARYAGFNNYYDKKRKTTVTVDETCVETTFYDKQARTAYIQTLETAGNLVLLSDTDGSLYISEEPSTVAATCNLIETHRDVPLTDPETLRGIQKSKNIRVASRTALIGASFMPAELLPFVIGSGPVEIAVLAGLMGVVAAGYDVVAYLAYNTKYLPRKYGRMALQLPDYIRNGASTKLSSSALPPYITNSDNKYDFLIPKGTTGRIDDYYITPASMVRSILVNTTDPTAMWDLIREDVQELAGTTAALKSAQEQQKLALKLVDGNEKAYRKSPEKETADGLQEATIGLMRQLADKTSGILVPQLFERRRMDLAEESRTLIDLEGVKKGVGSYFSELVLRTVLGIEPGDTGSMNEAEKTVAYLKKNLASVETARNVETALGHLSKKLGAVMVLPPNIDPSRIV